ncbi:MAG: Crp/Fnr family transcriptional regulator [Bacillota bacterium]
MDYYRHLHQLAPELQKRFLNSDFVIARYNCIQLSELLCDIQQKIKAALSEANKNIYLMYSDDSCCLLGEFLAASSGAGDSIYDCSDLADTIKYMADRVESIVNIYREEYKHELPINLDKLHSRTSTVIETLRQKSIKPLPEKTAAPVKIMQEDIFEELRNSVAKILDYSDISRSRGEYFISLIKAFRDLKDKLSDSEEAKSIRNDITPIYFEIYESVLKRALIEKCDRKLIQMFLNFSYMDEKLLSPNNIEALYQCCDSYINKAYASVFHMKDWLQLIYEKERNPSVNEFSMDYFDVFREMRKNGTVSDKEKAAYDSNKDARLNFEIGNMFRTNHKLCNRNTSTYFPILHDQLISKDLNKALVTPDMIMNSVNKALSIDFSAFYRELSYFNMSKGIEKEFVMQSVMPDIILMPAYGPNAVMWQDISGRIRNTPGRFIIPVFTEENIDDMIITLIGNFRWELCKTMMGVVWNDISIKSLTSEYMDYLQFYKKNKEMTEESKEKLKNQIKKHRGISRDIFTADYMLWIKYESDGVIRLNKQTRDMLYRYCPFTKEIRKRLLNNPVFAAATAQFESVRAKQIKELENRYSRYTRAGITLDKEMIDTLNYYKNQ